MRQALIVVLASSVLAAPLCADVLPSRRTAGAAREAGVSDRVARLGVPGAEAGLHSTELLPRDIAFFAARPDRVQVVGTPQDMFSGEADNLWYETWVGGGTLFLGLVTILYMIRNNE